MNDPAGCYCWEDGDLVVAVRVQPRASRDRIEGPHDGRLKVRLTAPPVDGKANAHLIKVLAKAFGVPKGAVTLEAGQAGRDKRVRIRAPKDLPPGSGIAPK